MTNTLSFPFPTSASMPNDSLLARSGSRRRSSAMSATRVVGRAETNGVDQHAERARNPEYTFSRGSRVGNAARVSVSSLLRQSWWSIGARRAMRRTCAHVAWTNEISDERGRGHVIGPPPLLFAPSSRQMSGATARSGSRNCSTGSFASRYSTTRASLARTTRLVHSSSSASDDVIAS